MCIYTVSTYLGSSRVDFALESMFQVTIEGIVYVVDSCLVKLEAFCPYNGTSYLNIAGCSQGSARQRAGRAGRTRPGHCFRCLEAIA